jgi:hypothetical protein
LRDIEGLGISAYVFEFSLKLTAIPAFDICLAGRGVILKKKPAKLQAGNDRKKEALSLLTRLGPAEIDVSYGAPKAGAESAYERQEFPRAAKL